MNNGGASNGTWTAIQSNGAGGGISAGIAFVNTTTASDYGRIDFAARSSGGWYPQIMSVFSGSVGIENTSPSYTLDDNGTFRATGYGAIGGNLSIGDQTATTGNFINVWRPSTTSDEIDAYTNSVGYRNLYFNGNSGNYFEVTSAGGIYEGGTSQLAGLVGINTAPSTYNLSVGGTTNITGATTLGSTL